MNKKILTVLIILGVVLVGVFMFKENDTYIYSYKDKKVDGNEYYEMLEAHYGTSFVYQFLEKEYFSSQTLEKEIEEQIKNSAQELLDQSDNEEDKAMLEVTLRSFGYDGTKELEAYMKNSYLRNKLIEDEFDQYFNDFESFAKEYKPRLITHVLIQTEEGITSEIQTQMDNIDKKLAESDDIKIDMLKLNDGETIISEQLGYVDKDANLVPEFIEASLKLKEGDVSDWVKTDYGYHRIFIESTSEKVITSVPKFKETILQNNPSLGMEIVLDKMQDDGVVIEEDLLSRFLEMAGV